MSSAKRDQNRENDLVIERCISSHVPICVNGRMLFASSKEDIDKFPIPFGYERCVRVDEGDLFGTLGLNTLKARRDHQALGAWSASVVVQVPGLRRA